MVVAEGSLLPAGNGAHMFNFSVREYCNRSQMTSQCVKSKKYVSGDGTLGTRL